MLQVVLYIRKGFYQNKLNNCIREPFTIMRHNLKVRKFVETLQTEHLNYCLQKCENQKVHITEVHSTKICKIIRIITFS